MTRVRTRNTWYQFSTTIGDHTPQTRKVYSGVLERGVRWIVEPRIQEEQCGFHPERRTVDLLYNFSRVLKDAWEFAQPVHMFCGSGEGI